VLRDHLKHNTFGTGRHGSLLELQGGHCPQLSKAARRNIMINQVVVFGTIGNDPQTKTFGSGNKKGYFSLAVNQFAKGEQLPDPLWLDCEYWNEMVDRIHKCGVRKGRQIVLIGALEPNVYTKAVGTEEVKISRVKLKVFSFQVIGPKDNVKTFVDTGDGAEANGGDLSEVAATMLSGETVQPMVH